MLPFCWHACFFGPVTTPEHLLWAHPYLPNWYEFLVQLLFYPLMMITLTGWLRMILIWSALDQSVLRALEQRPIRFAFDRLKGTGWLAVMRQNGLTQRWREMSRSAEAMRQMHSAAAFKPCFTLPVPASASPANHTPPDLEFVDADLLERLERHREMLNVFIRKTGSDPDGDMTPALAAEYLKRNQHDHDLGMQFRKHKDKPHPQDENELLLLYLIENDFADFSQELLRNILLPNWREHRTEFVESDPEDTIAVHGRRVGSEERETTETLQLHAGPATDDRDVHRAEEFLAIRYLSLIRAVLVNLRHLMTFIAMSFVFCIVSWNSYPFRPRQWVDAGLTALLFVLGGGVIWVMAQIHRDPILSRITRTRPNELGTDFFLRVAGVGAVPVLTWMAYQFPSISDGILRYLQPGVAATL